MTLIDKITAGSGSRAVLIAFSAAVVIAAAAYFLLSYNRTLNPVDEGYLLNNCVKVANGQVPHRDFYDDYGPASFWLGGALFKLFGVKIIVIRVFLVLMKSAMALLIFLIARKLLPLPFALIAAGLFVLNWGDPYLPAINILYAGYVCHFLALFAILFMMLYLERGNRRWLILTSLFLGISLLFKFPSAIFDFIAFSVFLSLKEQAIQTEGMPEVAGEAIRNPLRLHLLRSGKVFGLISVIVFYLLLFSLSHLNFYNFFIFLLPYYLLLGYMLVSEAQRFKAESPGRFWPGLRRCYSEILILASGLISFFALEVGYYFFVGGVSEFLYDTFILPLHISFYRPMEDVGLHSILIACLCVFILVFAWVRRRLKDAPERTVTAFWIASLAPLVALPVALVLRGTTFEEWHLRMNHVVPPLTLFLTSALFLLLWRREKREGAHSAETLFLGLLFIFGCQNFLLGFPRIDETHFQLNSTILFVLIAYLLLRLSSGWWTTLAGSVRARGAVSAALCIALLSIPQLWSMKLFYFFDPIITETEFEKVPIDVQYLIIQGQLKYYPMLPFPFPVSAGITIPLWLSPPLTDFVIRDMHKTVHFLRNNSGKDDKILVIGESQLIYLLVERESIIPKEDYFLFLATTELLDSDGIEKLTDEAFLRRIQEHMPKYIVQTTVVYSDHAKRIIAIWPETYDFIKDNYDTAKDFGHYIILESKLSKMVKPVSVSPSREGFQEEGPMHALAMTEQLVSDWL